MAKDDALAALRMWRDWSDRRDPLIRAARDSGATIAEIMDASGCAKGTVTTALTRTSPEGKRVDTAEAARRYHHPNFMAASANTSGNCPELIFRFSHMSPFIHNPETIEPDYRSDPELTSEDIAFLSQEWSAAITEWHRAVIRYDLGNSRWQEAGEKRAAWLRARQEMDAAYAALQTAADGQWRALLLAMATAHDKALTAAEAWDKAASYLAAKERAHLRAVGRDQGLTLAALAAENGVVISEWQILGPDAYKGDYPHYDGPAVAEVRPVIEQQQKLLKNASDLAGERN